MAYDSVHQQTVLFGGSSSGTNVPETTWLWDGVRWVQAKPSVKPRRRHAFGMAFDEARGNVILFGGFTGIGLSNETYSWDGTDWTLLAPAESPKPRSAFAMAYDSAREQIVLFGGQDLASYYNDETWVWDGGTWRQMHPVHSPPGRYGHSMAYDAARQQVVQFGGETSEGFSAETWVWDGADWTKMAPAHSPAPRRGVSMAYDESSQQTILHGGYTISGGALFSDTWSWDGAEWTQLNPATTLIWRGDSAMAYDRVRGQIVLFGGRGAWLSQHDTWVWDTVRPSSSRIQVEPASLNVTVYPNLQDPADLSLTISSLGEPLTVAATTPAKQGLRLPGVNTSGFLTPDTVQVTPATANLGPGTYNTEIVINAPGAANSPLHVPVTFTVAPYTYTPTPTALTFQVPANSTTPFVQQVSLSTWPFGYPNTNVASTQPWLTAPYSVGVTPVVFPVTVNPGGLSPGTYEGALTITSRDGEAGPTTLPVTLKVVSGLPLAVNPQAVSATLKQSATPYTIEIAVTATGSSSVSAVPTTASGGSWLTIQPATGDTPAARLFTVRLDPAGLAEGVYTGSIAATAAGNTVSVPVMLTVSGQRQFISQIASGSGWRTFITLVNLDQSDADFTLKFYRPDGSPLRFDSADVPNSSNTMAQGVIPVGGARTIRSSESTASIFQGWAELESTHRIGGVATFRQRVSGRPDLEGAVGVTNPAASFVLPFDNLQNFTTAAALVNANTLLSSTIQMTATTESGASLAAGSIDLPARGQLAVSLADRLPGIAGQRGVLEFTSGVAMTGLGLRFDPAGPFTSFPLLSASAPPMPDQVLAQLADGGPGGAWRTGVFLVNSGTTAAAFHLDFWDPTGAPLALPMDGYAQPVSSVEGSVPAGGLQVLSTHGGDTALLQGWAALHTTGKVTGLAVFRQNAASIFSNQAAVPAAAGGPNFLLPFDNADGFVTGVALVNTAAESPAQIDVSLRSESGAVLATDSIALPPHGQLTFRLIDRYPELLNRRGVVEFTAAGGSIAGLGLRFNPSGAFTSVPALTR